MSVLVVWEGADRGVVGTDAAGRAACGSVVSVRGVRGMVLGPWHAADAHATAPGVLRPMPKTGLSVARLDAGAWMDRLSVADWCCAQSGECCRRVDRVTMTVAEANALALARPEVAVTFASRDDGFVDLLAEPCPYLDGNTCSVYDVRPYNCRRWGCFREPGEPLTDMAPVPQRVLDSPDLQRQYARMQAEGHDWARAHGWRDE